MHVYFFKQGYEDWLRHKADREVNNRDFQVIRDGNAIDIKSMDIKVNRVQFLVPENEFSYFYTHTHTKKTNKQKNSPSGYSQYSSTAK